MATAHCIAHKTQEQMFHTTFQTHFPPPPSDSSTEEPPVNPPAIGGLGNSGLGNSDNLSLRIKEQSTEEPPANVGESSQHVDVGESSQHADVGESSQHANEQSTEEPEKGNISNDPVRTPCLSENIADYIGYTNRDCVPITCPLDAI